MVEDSWKDGTGAADILSRVCGQSIEFVEDDVQELLAANPDLGQMFDWLNWIGYTADIPELGYKRGLDADWNPLSTQLGWLDRMSDHE